MAEKHTRRVGDRGQVTIPKEFREAENIRGGDEVVVEREDGTLVIRKAIDEERLKAAYRRTADRDKQLAEEWAGTSSEANHYLGESPDISE